MASSLASGRREYVYFLRISSTVNLALIWYGFRGVYSSKSSSRRCLFFWSQANLTFACKWWHTYLNECYCLKKCVFLNHKTHIKNYNYKQKFKLLKLNSSANWKQKQKTTTINIQQEKRSKALTENLIIFIIYVFLFMGCIGLGLLGFEDKLFLICEAMNTLQGL